MNAVRCAILGLVALCTVQSLAAQQLKIGGQVRPRWEYRNPFLALGGAAETWVSMRTRAQVTASLDRNVTAFVQLQDVRIWGEETNTLGDFSAHGLDLHQGYIDVRSSGPTVFSGRAGRQDALDGLGASVLA